MSSRQQLLLYGAGITACTLAMTRLEHFTLQGWSYLILFTLAFISYLLAWRVVIYTPRAVALRWILLGAVIMRIPLLFTTPTLSSDVWRYIWDGHVTSHGINPYEYRVDSPELIELRTPLHERIDHQWMASPYPPVAQAVFVGTTLIAPENHHAMQVVFTLFDIAISVALAYFLQMLRRPQTWVLLYAWHPLIVVEFAHGAHVDSLMTLLIIGSLIALQKNRPLWSAGLLALATLTKFIPALLVPIMLRRWGIKATMLYGAVIIGLFLPFVMGAGINQDGTGILGAATIYAERWKTNDGLFFWIVEWLTPLTVNPIQMGRIIVNAFLGLIGLGVMAKRLSPILAASILIGAYLLTVSAMFPWYLTWLIALLSLWEWQNNRAVQIAMIAWLYFSWAVNASYLFYLDPTDPHESVWIRWVEYFPLFIGLGIAGLVYLYGTGLLNFLPSRQPNHEHPTHNEEPGIERN